MLTTAIVGAGAPIANGLALAAQMRGEDRVTIVNFGDGATSIGAVHEAMNLAGVWKLPVIFLCQNNLIGEYTPIPGYTASKDFASRAAGYGFKGVRLDANDVPAFYRGMKEVVEGSAGEEEARISSRPSRMRLGPHAGVGDTHELSADELKAAQGSVAGSRRSADAARSRGLHRAELAKIDEAARQEVEQAIDQGDWPPKSRRRKRRCSMSTPIPTSRRAAATIRAVRRRPPPRARPRPC